MANHKRIKNRPADEHRFQIRYGDVNNPTWRAKRHPVGFDPLGVDTTLVVGVHPEADLIVAVDPAVYDPLPLGISIFFKDAEVEAALESGWHVWERENIAGTRRKDARTQFGLETLIAFRPERFLDYVRFEHSVQGLDLDPPLRFHAARSAASGAGSGLHKLEREFSLSGPEILDIIGERPRLGMAVRGGIAERHLQKTLEADPKVSTIELGQVEGPPDFIIMVGAETVTVECKNASPKPYADETPKVETQKTRASKGDPKSRLYDSSQFDVVAACMYGPWRRWEFRYKRSTQLKPDKKFPDRIAPLQRIDETWSKTVAEAFARK